MIEALFIPTDKDLTMRALPAFTAATALAATFFVYPNLMASATEASLPEGATKIGWDVTGPGPHFGLRYREADGTPCIRSGVVDSCGIQRALGLDPAK